MFVFLFKQKTAYDMRISDWSSDVCSSDLPQSSAITHPNSKDLLRGLRLSEGLLLALELQDLSSPPAPSALFHDLRCGQAVIRRRHFSRKIKTEPLPHRQSDSVEAFSTPQEALSMYDCRRHQCQSVSNL